MTGSYLTRTPFGRVIDALNDLGIRTRITHNQTRVKCHCPAHDDRRASLSITLAHGHVVLINCFAGCHVEDVLGALGLRLADLRDDRPRSVMHEPPPPPKPVHPLFGVDADHVARRIATQRTIENDPIYWRQRGDEFAAADCAAEAVICRHYADALTDADDDDHYPLALQAGMAGQPWGPFPRLREQE